MIFNELMEAADELPGRIRNIPILHTTSLATFLMVPTSILQSYDHTLTGYIVMHGYDIAQLQLSRMNTGLRYGGRDTLSHSLQTTSSNRTSIDICLTYAVLPLADRTQTPITHERHRKG